MARCHSAAFWTQDGQRSVWGSSRTRTTTWWGGRMSASSTLWRRTAMPQRSRIPRNDRSQNQRPREEAKAHSQRISSRSHIGRCGCCGRRIAGAFEISLFRPFVCEDPIFFEFIAEVAATNPLQLPDLFAIHLDDPRSQCRYYILDEIYMAYALALSWGVSWWCNRKDFYGSRKETGVIAGRSARLVHFGSAALLPQWLQAWETADCKAMVSGSTFRRSCAGWQHPSIHCSGWHGKECS